MAAGNKVHTHGNDLKHEVRLTAYWEETPCGQFIQELMQSRHFFKTQGIKPATDFKHAVNLSYPSACWDRLQPLTG